MKKSLNFLYHETNWYLKEVLGNIITDITQVPCTTSPGFSTEGVAVCEYTIHTPIPHRWCQCEFCEKDDVIRKFTLCLSLEHSGLWDPVESERLHSSRTYGNSWWVHFPETVETVRENTKGERNIPQTTISMFKIANFIFPVYLSYH